VIRTQLKLFPEETKKGQVTKTTRIRQSSSLSLKDADPLVGHIGKNFSTSDRRYYAGMIDGDGCISLRVTKKNTPVLMVALNLRYDHAEPILKLAEMFDLTISKRSYLIPRGKAQPQLKTVLAGIKGKLFLFSIYPYLLEKKEKARDALISVGCPEDYLPKDRQFSFEYLAGYTDAEGRIRFGLQHHKARAGYSPCSSYKMYYELISNDNNHLQFIKQNLIDRGFDHFRKDYIDTYRSLSKEERLKRHPTTHIVLGGKPAQLSKFYKNIEPFILIKHKKDNMLATMKYNDIINL
jgi:hypothetical protein